MVTAPGGAAQPHPTHWEHSHPVERPTRPRQDRRPFPPTPHIRPPHPWPTEPRPDHTSQTRTFQSRTFQTHLRGHTFGTRTFGPGPSGLAPQGPDLRNPHLPAWDSAPCVPEHKLAPGLTGTAVPSRTSPQLFEPLPPDTPRFFAHVVTPSPCQGIFPALTRRRGHRDNGAIGVSPEPPTPRPPTTTKQGSPSRKNPPIHTLDQDHDSPARLMQMRLNGPFTHPESPRIPP